MQLPNRELTVSERKALLDFATVGQGMPWDISHWVSHVRNYSAGIDGYTTLDRQLGNLVFRRMMTYAFQERGTQPVFVYNGHDGNLWTVTSADGIDELATDVTKHSLRVAGPQRVASWISSTLSVVMGVCVRCGAKASVRPTLQADNSDFALQYRPAAYLPYPADFSSAVHQAILGRLTAASAGGTAQTYGQYLPSCAALCRKCAAGWACQECSAKPPFEAASPDLIGMLTDLRCLGCLGVSLTAVKPPKHGLAEWRKLRNIIK